MGKIKHSEKNGKTHILSEREINYLKILNISLQYHVWKDKIISGFLYFICTTRFGYKENENLIFEIDLDSDKSELKVKEVPAEAIEKAINNSGPST